MSGPCLLTRPGCGLCEEFLAQWRAAFPGLDLPRVNVDRDAALARRYGDTIPVLLDEQDQPLCSAHFERDACAPLAARMAGRG